MDTDCLSMVTDILALFNDVCKVFLIYCYTLNYLKIFETSFFTNTVSYSWY